MSPESIQSRMKAVFRYQLAHRLPVQNAGWERAAFYAGVLAAHDATQDPEYLDEALRWGEENKWEFNVDPRGYWNADNQSCGWSYLGLYLLRGGDEKIAFARKTLDEMVATPPRGRAEWWWCDALFMAPPVLVRLSRITGDARYTALMNTMWWDTTDFLYDKEVHLYYRDKNFFDKRTKNGKKVFWSRGNGWVMGGIVRVLQDLPADDSNRGEYIRLYKEMANALAAAQATDGYWHMSLLDPDEFPTPETSGTGFYTYALTWGINRGVLDWATFEPIVSKSWAALVRCVYPSGKLGWVQPVAASPYSISCTDTHEFGVGAFLLAGSEMLRMRQGNP